MGWSAPSREHVSAALGREAAEVGDEWDSLEEQGAVFEGEAAGITGGQPGLDDYSASEWANAGSDQDHAVAYEAEQETAPANGRYEQDSQWAEARPSAEAAADDGYYFETASVQRDEPFPIEIFTSETESRDEQGQGVKAGFEPAEPLASLDVESGERRWGDLLPIKTRGQSKASPVSSDTEDYTVPGRLNVPPETGEEGSRTVWPARDVSAFGGAEGSFEPESQSGPPEIEDGPHETAGITAAAHPADKAEFAEAAQQHDPATPESPNLAQAQVLPPITPVAEPSSGEREPEPAKAATDSGASHRGDFGPGSPREGTDGLSQFAATLSGRNAVSTGAASDAQHESGQKSKLICFLPVQGGSGSSTVSLHVAEAISRHSSGRVLIADFDFHCGTLAFRLGLKPTHTLRDVFEWKHDKDLIWESAVCRWKKLDVLVAPPTNAAIRPQCFDTLPEIFASALKRYPYVIIDHPDAIYSSSRHILTLANLVYLVCTPEMTSLHLARRKVQQIRALGVPNDRMRLIVNRASSWGSLGVKDIGKIVGVPVSWALDNDYAALRDAVWNGGLVEEGSTLAAQLRSLGWSVMGREAPVSESAVPVAAVSQPE
jgi:MinD-like ATPase involved in chromosome partitioning or flagellar assembly